MMAVGMVILLSALWLADKYLDNGGRVVQLSQALRRLGRGGGGLRARTDP